MSDVRAEYWLGAQECIAAADKAVSELKTPVESCTDLPAAYWVNMDRARVFATLASIPIDVLMGAAEVERDRIETRAESRKEAEEFIGKLGLSE